MDVRLPGWIGRTERRASRLPFVVLIAQEQSKREPDHEHG